MRGAGCWTGGLSAPLSRSSRFWPRSGRGFRWHAGRSSTPGPALETRRYHVDTASEPGPSERVRELVRRDPEAAASVLQRWTGQGGRV